MAKVGYPPRPRTIRHSFVSRLRALAEKAPRAQKKLPATIRRRGGGLFQ